MVNDTTPRQEVGLGIKGCLSPSENQKFNGLANSVLSTNDTVTIQQIFSASFAPAVTKSAETSIWYT